MKIYHNRDSYLQADVKAETETWWSWEEADDW